MLSLIYTHSEHMSTAWEPAELLHILVILLAAVRKPIPPLTKHFFPSCFMFLGYIRLFATADREKHERA